MLKIFCCKPIGNDNTGIFISISGLKIGFYFKTKGKQVKQLLYQGDEKMNL